MTLWGWILLACAISIATKFLGFLVPARLLDNPRMLRVAGSLTIGLLAALTAVNTFASGQALVVDARVAALLAAAVALWLKAPFLVVVAVGAVAAGIARLLGAA
ncbi:AzlD domain-containing protein [Arthrobacter agilis]|uniref:AzlD domain-containing protein n=1 Tax=Arthrobacter agilis TaxID=37921 RepID=UPI000B35E8AF|nr:AzlD domain-containing protein [Arthrobacter agilis]OUM42421.1 branched-chain amino acid transporter AzlD [Arthrobacter agilis]PPB45762.1 branched-chain amino acid transporter AzlD [Arthrobacter agilis]TPV26255.1 AzlD domain-containing protein [Arthrobacter agilis]VDR30897.1 Branched-chain amino acid transport protein (AzlD) [Arthrobacter agilis]